MPPKGQLIFPGTYRLKRRAEFQRLYSRGLRVPGRFVVLFVMRAEGQHGRYGVTASRKIGGAVTRTRCKRRLRELYRIHRLDDAVAGYDIVANAKRGCASAPWSELEKDFLQCLMRSRKRDRGAANG